MRTLDDDELFYMERCDEETVLRSVSYSYVKSLLFAFSGWDRYLLTEDWVLSGFLQTLIHRRCRNVFFKFKVIYIGGGSQVVDLLNRNRTERFLAEPGNVIAVLDGDHREEKFAKFDDVYFVPFDNVEIALYKYYTEDDFPHKLPNGIGFNGHKDLFHSIQHHHVMSIEQIYEYICHRKDRDLEPLVTVLEEFLS